MAEEDFVAEVGGDTAENERILRNNCQYFVVQVTARGMEGPNGQDRLRVTAKLPFTSARRRQLAVAEGPHCGTLLLVKGSPEALLFDK